MEAVEQDEAVIELRKMLAQIDTSWRAMAVLGPDEELSAALNDAATKTAAYLSRYDDRPESRDRRRARAKKEPPR